MILNHPFMISARLMPAVRIGDATLSFDHEDGTRFYLDVPGKRAAVIRGYHLPSILRTEEEKVLTAFADLMDFAQSSNDAVSFKHCYGKKTSSYALFRPVVRKFFYEQRNDIEGLVMDLRDMEDS